MGVVTDLTSGVSCEYAHEAELGEGPLWVEDEGCLYWVDILQKQVHRFDPSTRSNTTWQFETEVTALAQRESGGFIATVRDGYALIDFNQGSITPLKLMESAVPGNRFNDGKVDAHGNFWAGSMDDNLQSPTGILYRMSPDHSVEVMDDGYIITNGPAFSPDGRTMYHNDTGIGVIYAFDVDEHQNIANKREFVRLDKEADGSTDGITVDREGGIWLAHFGGGRVTRFSPDGEVLKVIGLPAPNITSCTFGGPGLDTLYITTARCLMPEDQLRQFPLAGSLFSCIPGVAGLATPKFKG